MSTDPEQASAQQPAGDGPPVMPDFSGIAGLSMNRSLFHLPGHEIIMARVMRLFAEQYRCGLPALDGLLKAGLWHDARQQLHALRGSSGAAGAVDLTAQAQRLEIRLLEASALDAAAIAGLRLEADGLSQGLITLITVLDQRLAAAT